MMYCPECGHEREPTKGDIEYAKVCVLLTYKDYPEGSMEYIYRKRAYDRFQENLKITKMVFAKKSGGGKPVKFVRHGRVSDER